MMIRLKRNGWLDILLVWLLHQTIVLSSAYFGPNLLAGKHGPLAPAATLLKALTHWDGRWYLRIAVTGYSAKAAAFFPLYPWSIKGLTLLGFSPELAALTISNLAFLAVLILFYHLVRLDNEAEAAVRALWYLALFPTALFFTTAYTESLYLALVLLALYLARGKHWFWAGICGGLAGLTRSLGVLLVLPLYLEYRRQLSQTLPPRSPGQKFGWVWLALVPTGLGVFMFYLWRTLGNPLAFMAAQRFWKRTLGFPWATLYHAFTQNLPQVNIGNLFFTLFALIFLGLAINRISPVYSAYLFYGLLIPLSTPARHSPLLSMPRFVVVLFPVFIVMALVIKSERLHWAVLCSFTALLCLMSIMFGSSRWVA